MHRGRGGKPQSTDGSVLIYGVHAVRAALDNPVRIKRRLLVTKNALARLTEAGEVGGVKIEERSPRELDRLVGPDAVHQGVILESDPLPRHELDDLEDAGLLVVLDQITDPHNVGAILRTACAFGAAAVITTSRYSPQESGVLAKSASGALDLVPLIEVGNLGETIVRLKKLGIWCVGLDSEAETALQPGSGDRKFAVVLGAEGKGLRNKTRSLCDEMLRLDMPGPIKSLNVSNAAAIVLYALSQK